MKTLSSSFRTYCTTVLAAIANVAFDALAGATAYSSKTGVDHARHVCVVAVWWWILGRTGCVCREAWRCV